MNTQDNFLLLKLKLDDAFLGLFDLIPDTCFFVKDTKGRLVYCNETHRKAIFRYGNSQDLYGKNNHDFFPNVLAKKFSKDDKHVISAGQSLVESIELNIASNGLLSWFSTTKIPARNVHGKIVGLIGISRKLEFADCKLAEYQLLVPAIQYIQKKFSEKILVLDLALACQITESTFRREFMRVFRMTPLRFILRIRLHEACLRLVAGTESVGSITLNCGFEDQNYFARHFKKSMGVTPTEFRKFHKRNK